jgi:hypothetical protein
MSERPSPTTTLTAEGQLLIGITHDVLVASQVEGRVFVDGGQANPTEHWMLRPSFRAPRVGDPDVVVRAVSNSEKLQDLFRWGRAVPGTKYIRAACSEQAIPAG